MKSALRTASLTLFLGALWLSPGVVRAAPPEPRAEADALILKLDVPATRERIAAPLAKAKDARTRAQNARGAGDLRHAAALETLALLWAQVAEDLLSTAAAEQQLADVQKKASDLERKALDTQALVEQAIARRGRAQQNLNAAEAKSAASPEPGKAKPPAKSEPKAPAKAHTKPAGPRE